jgi:hypothetical protein
MNQDELRRMELPGNGAFVTSEPTPRLWILLWALWGLIVGGLIVFCDGNIAVGVCFMIWGLAISIVGWQGIMFGCFAIHDWVDRHLNDHKVKEEALTESFQLADAFMSDRNPSELDLSDVDEMMPEESLGRDTPVRQKWLQQELFAGIAFAPWLMGLTHGLGIGTLLGALLGLLPDDGVTVTKGALGGCVIGTTVMMCLTAVISAIFSPRKCISLRHRLMMFVSPVFVLPALLEAAWMWSRWFAGRWKPVRR